MANFQPKISQKWPVMAKIPKYFFDPIWLCFTSIQLIGMHLFFFIKELWVDLLNKNSKIGPKMALNGKKSQFFNIDPIWLCLKSIQLIGTRLFFYIKEVRVDLLNKNLKNGHFSTKNGPKMALNGQNPQIFSMGPVKL